jgi:hypothetical protein
LIVASTVALPPAGTVTLGGANVTVAALPATLGAKVDPNVVTPDTCDNA